MRLAGVRTPKQDDVCLFNFAVGACPASRSENRRQTDDAGGVSSAVAAVDVIAADHGAHKFLRHVIQFVGGFRATEHAERAWAVLFDLRAKSGSNAIQRLIPSGRSVLAVFPDQRSFQPVPHRITHFSPRLLFCGSYDTRKHGYPNIL